MVQPNIRRARQIRLPPHTRCGKTKLRTKPSECGTLKEKFWNNLDSRLHGLFVFISTPTMIMI